jgi:hypothetical protein
MLRACIVGTFGDASSPTRIAEWWDKICTGEVCRAVPLEEYCHGFYDYVCMRVMITGISIMDAE